MLTRVAPHAADGSVTDSTITSETGGGTVTTPSGTGAPVTTSGGPVEPGRTCWRGSKEDSAASAACSPAYIVAKLFRLPWIRPVPRASQMPGAVPVMSPEMLRRQSALTLFCLHLQVMVGLSALAMVAMGVWHSAETLMPPAEVSRQLANSLYLLTAHYQPWKAYNRCRAHSGCSAVLPAG